MSTKEIKETITKKIEDYRERTLERVLHLVTAGLPAESQVFQKNVYINALSYAVQNALSNPGLTTEQRLDYVIQNLAIGQHFAESLLEDILKQTSEKKETVN